VTTLPSDDASERQEDLRKQVTSLLRHVVGPDYPFKVPSHFSHLKFSFQSLSFS
jgi:hypothetical protein